MRYLDSSVSDPSQAAASWMRETIREGVCHYRCQAGYFTMEGGAVLLPALKDWAHQGADIRILLGSNQASTLASHVSYLAGGLGLPRPNVRLGVVRYGGALFHPKVYHFVRPDETETAFVGSANMTGPGLSGSNIETGLVVDTREGDDPAVLAAIRDSIDAWFEKAPPELFPITSAEDIQRLLEQGHLALIPEPRKPEPKPAAGAGAVLIPRTPLVRMERPDAPRSPGPAAAAGKPSSEVDPELTRRFLRNTEASFHYPQGTHLGHILAVLWRLATGRVGTAFDDEYIRLSGSLGSGRIAAFRRQIKYKLLAAMEMGLVLDIRLTDATTEYVPGLTDRGQDLWDRVAPFINVGDLEMPALSTRFPQPAPFYNQLLKNARDRSAAFRDLYDETMLAMPAVAQMLTFLRQFPEPRIGKDDIYRGFFEFDPVVEFCDLMGIEPGTEESARHRCPLLLNILESLGLITQESRHVVRLAAT